MKILLTIIIATAISISADGKNSDNRFEFLIGKCSDINSGNYKCNSYLALASYIQSLEKSKAVEVIREYAILAKHEDQIIILTKMLFQPKEDSVLRRPWIGAASFVGNTDYNDWITEPIELINNIPFLITSGYALGGSPESSLKYLEYCLENGEWTKNIYSVKSSQELNDGLKILIDSKKWKTELLSPDRAFFEGQIN